MRYFDSSAFVKRYVVEPCSDAVQQLLMVGDACVSRLAHLEAASAFHRRRRDGEIGDDEVARVLAQLEIDCAELTIVEVSPALCEIARELLVRHPLRTLDAIQLAGALLMRQEPHLCGEFIVFDVRLAAAARAEGLAVWP